MGMIRRNEMIAWAKQTLVASAQSVIEQIKPLTWRIRLAQMKLVRYETRAPETNHNHSERSAAER